MKNALLLAAALLAVPFAPLRADGPADIPASAKWALAVDVRAAGAAPMLTDLFGRIAPAKRRDAANKLNAVKALFGIDLLKDVDRLVVAGGGQAQNAGVAYLYATLDVPRLTAILAGNSTFASADCHGFQLLSWTDDKDKRQKFGAFARPGLTLLSDRRECLVEALAVLAGQQPALAADAPLAAALARSPQRLAALCATDIAGIVGNQPQAEILKQAAALSFALRAPDPETLAADLAVSAHTDETALKIRQLIQGFQALALLRAAEEPEGAALASLAQITQEGRTVGVSMRLTRATVETLIRQREAREAARAAAAAAPAAPPAP